MTPAETLSEAILSAAGSGLRHYTPHSRERILAAAQAQIEDIRLNAICDERASGPLIAVSLDDLDRPATPTGDSA